MTVAIIDGDTACYMACFLRWQDKPKKKDPAVPVIEPTPAENAKFLEEAWVRLKRHFKELQEICFADRIKAAVKGGEGFRDVMYPAYKAQRKAAKRGTDLFVPTLRERLIESGLAVPALGMEADDYIRIWQQEAVASGEDYVICREDKDLKCIPGRHWHLKHNEFIIVSESEACRFYYEQLLQGDPTDNIKAVPGVGPKKAKNFLLEETDEKGFQTVVTQVYQAAFGRHWRRELVFTGSLIYLLKTPDDKFTLDGWPDIEYIPTEAELEEELAEEQAKAALLDTVESNDSGILLGQQIVNAGEEMMRAAALTFPNHPVIPRKTSLFNCPE